MSVSDNKAMIWLNRIEDSLLVAILTSLIILAVYQIISRNFFSSGLVWIDPLLRTLVLWVGLSGAVVAARSDKHIRIDIFTKYMPSRVLPYVHRLVYLSSLVICLLIAWHSARFVLSEYEYQTIAFSAVPAWLTASIIPLSFTLIAFRYCLLLFASDNSDAKDGSDS